MDKGRATFYAKSTNLSLHGDEQLAESFPRPRDGHKVVGSLGGHQAVPCRPWPKGSPFPHAQVQLHLLQCEQLALHQPRALGAKERKVRQDPENPSVEATLSSPKQKSLCLACGCPVLPL